MSSQVSDDPVTQLKALEGALSALTAKQTAAFVKTLRAQVAGLVPVIADNIKSMQEGEAFGQTLQQAQAKALEEFAAAVRGITEGLRPGSAPSLAPPPAASSAGSRAPAGGARPLFPPGCGSGPASPEAFYRVRQALAAALKSAGAAFKGSHPALAKAIRGVVEELEEAGLFD